MTQATSPGVACVRYKGPATLNSCLPNRCPALAYNLEHFVYDEATDAYTCPEGHTLSANGHVYTKNLNRSHPDQLSSVPHQGLQDVPGASALHHRQKRQAHRAQPLLTTL